MRTDRSATSITLITVFIFTVGFIGFASAEGLKDRFLARSPVIGDLMDRRIVGENKSGFLEFVGGKKENQAVVDAENLDRQKLYSAIAKKRGLTPEAVGAQRALQIAKTAKPGVMLQDANGKWYKK
jgi:uncharacterized protein YdbL (DUF1318 family)